MTDSDASMPAAALAERIHTLLRPRIQASSGPFVVGLSGLQGSGKSTLASALAATANRHGLPSVVLSLDDYYLSLDPRRRLARDVHPLLRTRGVPGTHDLQALLDAVDGAAGIDAGHPLRIPHFDKGRDTRAPASSDTIVVCSPRLLIVEGWCVGVPTQPDAALATAVNALEADADPDGRWRRWVNRRLADYQALWRRFDALAVLQAPDWNVVRQWRGQAEQALRARGAERAMDDRALQRFIAHYERISRHALATLPAVADIVVCLDAQRHPVCIREQRRTAPGDDPQAP